MKTKQTFNLSPLAIARLVILCKKGFYDLNLENLFTKVFNSQDKSYRLEGLLTTIHILSAKTFKAYPNFKNWEQINNNINNWYQNGDSKILFRMTQ